jgi:hypothetical protein
MYNLPVVLYGCETWSLTLREERRPKVLENVVLRRIFVPQRVEMTREWKKLNNEEFNDLYFSPNIDRVIKSRRMRFGGSCSKYGESRGAYRFWWENGGKETIWKTQSWMCT